MSSVIEVAAADAARRFAEVATGSIARFRVLAERAAGAEPPGFAVTVVAGNAPGPTGVFTAGVHGDEYEGPAGLLQLLTQVTPADLSGRLLIAPVVNEAAFAAGNRLSPLDGVNLARIFPGDGGDGPSHRLARAVMVSLVAPADFIVDSHAGGSRAAFIPVSGYYDHRDGRVGAEAAAASLGLARSMGLGHIWRLPSNDGVLSFEAAKRGVSSCGAEIGGRGGCLSTDAELYCTAYLSVLRHRGMLAGEGLPLTTALVEGDFVAAGRTGLFEPVAALGMLVSQGDLLGILRDAYGNAVECLSPRDGRVVAMRHLNAVVPGEPAYAVMRESALAD